MTKNKGYRELSESGNALLGTMRATILAQLEKNHAKFEKMLKTLDGTLNVVRECEGDAPDGLITEIKQIKKVLSNMKAETDEAEDLLCGLWKKTGQPLVPTPAATDPLDFYAERKNMDKLYDKPMSKEEFSEVVDNDQKLGGNGPTTNIGIERGPKVPEEKIESEYTLTDEDVEQLVKALKKQEK